MRSATYAYHVNSRGCENFGPQNYSVMETLTETRDGVCVSKRVTGYDESGDVSRGPETETIVGADFDNACAYREKNGYLKIG